MSGSTTNKTITIARHPLPLNERTMEQICVAIGCAGTVLSVIAQRKICEKESQVFRDKETGCCLGGGFKYLLFSPLPGEMIQFD